MRGIQFYCLACIGISWMLGSHAVETGPDTAQPVLHFGGCGGVYFLVEPGAFWVEVEKIDLHKTGRKTFLRAILTGPDRTVLRDEYLPYDGGGKGSGLGAVQQLKLSVEVTAKGIYALNITVSEDRYGEDIAWGFRTNCAKYLIETSRGHRDAPHEEPFVLLSPGVGGDVCFLPEKDAVSLDLAGVDAGKGAPVLYDAHGKEIAVVQPDEKGNAHCEVTAEVSREAVPWRLRLPDFKAVVQIDGVTRWKTKREATLFSLWTPRLESWFPFHENRWLLAPYSRTLYGDAGTEGSAVFEVYNNAAEERTFELSLEFPDRPWAARLESSRVTVPGKKAETVRVTYTMPGEGDRHCCRIRVTPNDTPACTTYSSLFLHRGVAPAAGPLPIPWVLKPYAHENEQLGYCPDYPLTNQVYFDGNNRPYISSDASVWYWRDGAWREIAVAKNAAGASVAFATDSSKVAFDDANNVYLVGKVKGAPVLLSMSEGSDCLRVCPIPGHGAFDIEQFSGHNRTDGPPPLVRYTRTEHDPNLIWRSLNDLDLFLPVKEADGMVSLPGPIRISTKCIGFSDHSGIPSSVVSREGKVHVVWGEATDPAEKVEGVPTYAVTYDRASKTLGQPALVGYGPPANDVHNTPCITMDSQGYLHVLVGTHGSTFRYARSLQPNDAGGGWTAAEAIGPGLRQTYVGLVCDTEDVLHLVFRLWREDTAYFPASYYATLAYMSKRPGEAWSEPRVLVAPPFSEYSVFYHRLTIDREGRLFLSYDYWSTYWFYRNDRRGDRRALMMSSDGGGSWRLVGGEVWTR